MSSKDIETVSKRKQNAIVEINDRFGVGDTVRTLQRLMNEVTKKEINADTVNAACNCVQNLNLTIKTAMQAAKFLADKND